MFRQPRPVGARGTRTVTDKNQAFIASRIATPAFQSSKWRTGPGGEITTSMAASGTCSDDKYGNPRVKVCTCKSTINYVTAKTLQKRRDLKAFAATVAKGQFAGQERGAFMRAFLEKYPNYKKGFGTMPATPAPDIE